MRARIASPTPVTAAPSPDIRAFVNRGGKLIQYHGWNDSVVPPDGSVAYFFALTQFELLRHMPKAVADRYIEKLTPPARRRDGRGVRQEGAAIPPLVHVMLTALPFELHVA